METGGSFRAEAHHWSDGSIDLYTARCARCPVMMVTPNINPATDPSSESIRAFVTGGWRIEDALILCPDHAQ